MSKFGSRAKGSVAERAVAKILEEWWASYEPGTRFVKTPLSGGWSTANVRSEFRASGDLMTTSTNFPFTIEAKRREGWSLPNFLAGKQSPPWVWWEQAVKQGEESKLLPLLWLRKNRMGFVHKSKRAPGAIAKPWLIVAPLSVCAHVDGEIETWGPRDYASQFFAGLFTLETLLAQDPQQLSERLKKATL